jgi:hypothetical protein
LSSISIDEVKQKFKKMLDAAFDEEDIDLKFCIVICIHISREVFYTECIKSAKKNILIPSKSISWGGVSEKGGSTGDQPTT